MTTALNAVLPAVVLVAASAVTIAAAAVVEDPVVETKGDLYASVDIAPGNWETLVFSRGEDTTVLTRVAP